MEQLIPSDSQAGQTQKSNFCLPSNECASNNYQSDSLSADQYPKRLTIILDLDETLVHSSFTPSDNTSFNLSVPFNQETYQVYVQVRPGAENFLKTLCYLKYDSNPLSMNFVFDVFIFTASRSEYAIPVVQTFAPWFPPSRILTRQHCRFIPNQADSSLSVLVKDLSIFQDRDLSKIILIDNSSDSFLLQPNNGIQIPSWFGDPSDSLLTDNGQASLFFFLLYCAQSSAVQPILSGAVPSFNSN